MCLNHVVEAGRGGLSFNVPPRKKGEKKTWAALHEEKSGAGKKKKKKKYLPLVDFHTKCAENESRETSPEKKGRKIAHPDGRRGGKLNLIVQGGRVIENRR